MKQMLTDNEFLDGLTNLFLREGITGLTVGEIAARLRCSRRRLYGIAPTKEAIFSVMVDRYFRARLDEGEALLRGEQDLTVALAAYLDVGVRSSGRVSAQFVNDVENNDATRASFDAYQQARADGLSQLIDEGVRRGIFVACHGAVVAELMLGASMLLRRPAFLVRANVTIEEAFREFYRVFLGGILAKAAAPNAIQEGGRTDRKIVKGGSKRQATSKAPARAKPK